MTLVPSCLSSSSWRITLVKVFPSKETTTGSSPRICSMLVSSSMERLLYNLVALRKLFHLNRRPNFSCLILCPLLVEVKSTEDAKNPQRSRKWGLYLTIVGRVSLAHPLRVRLVDLWYSNTKFQLYAVKVSLVYLLDKITSKVCWVLTQATWLKCICWTRTN